MSYTLEYFIDKFKSIPVEQWSDTSTWRSSSSKDFMGHLNSYANAVSEEGDAFIDLTVGNINDEVGRLLLLYMINDGEGRFGRIGTNPKDRWVRWLEALHRKNNRTSQAA